MGERGRPLHARSRSGTLTAAPTIAPRRPGFYHLAVIRGATREVLSEPTLVVMVPFDRKLGDWVNGYRIGTYLSERFGGGYDRPVGFVEVTPSMLDLAITKHLKLVRLRDARRSGRRVAEVRRAQSAPARQAGADLRRSRKPTCVPGSRSTCTPDSARRRTTRASSARRATAGTSTATRPISRWTRTATAGSR